MTFPYCYMLLDSHFMTFSLFTLSKCSHPIQINSLSIQVLTENDQTLYDSYVIYDIITLKYYSIYDHFQIFMQVYTYSGVNKSNNNKIIILPPQTHTHINKNKIKLEQLLTFLRWCQLY